MNDSARRVLVTFAGTELGRALVRELLREASTERVLVLGANPSLLPTGDARLIFAQADVHRRRDVWKLLLSQALDERIDAIVHDPLEPSADAAHRGAWHADVSTLRQLLQLAEEHPTIRHFVLRSSIEVYRVSAEQPVLIEEDHPLHLTRHMDERTRSLLEADLYTCSRIAQSRLQISVLRCAEVLWPKCGSELFDYLCAPVCFRPLGFDPMLNLLTPEDASLALRLALQASARGVFNIPGKDTLPLSELVHALGRFGVALPGTLLSPLYLLRRAATRAEFRYAANRGRFHYSGILSGVRAKLELGYAPRAGLEFKTLGREVTQHTRRFLHVPGRFRP